MDSDDEQDWEEVEVPEQAGHFEITLNPVAAVANKKGTTKKKAGVSHAERLVRIDCHKIHTICLLVNARIRNDWLNDELLHARLLSVTPLTLQNSFAMIHKSRVPEQAKRGRMFEAAMNRLAEWWYSSFFEVLDHGHIRNRTYEDVQNLLQSNGVLTEPVLDTPLTPEMVQDMLGDEGEPIRSVNSLMKRVLMQSGSRDLSGQLFTALCRALGIPARLVVSLQSVPWQVGVGKPKPSYSRKGKGKAKAEANEEDDDDDMEEVQILDSTPSGSGVATPSSEQNGKSKGKEKSKKPQIRLRKPQTVSTPKNDEPPDPTLIPPVFWTEVFSRPDGRWMPVNPLRALVNETKSFDPPSGPRSQNRLVYVVAFEEDGYARDVTRRYARNYGAKVAKLQGGSSSAGMGGSKARMAWWEGLLGLVTRPYRLQRDDVEDDELEVAQITEGMPTTIAGFKDHPLYVLTRHLKQTETIYPPPPTTPELGKFRGEPVYPRSSVVNLKTPENWLRSEGRVVKEGEQPLKSVKVRASTINRQRELEILKDELREAGGGGEGAEANASSSKETVLQGLYSRVQTEPYQPEPVIDGKIPKNNFGNIDLYVKSMLPAGAVHIPFKGVAKIAKKLGFDFAEAVTGFEFKKRRAFPVMEGIVVAKENETTIIEAYMEATQDAEEKARLKREERVLKRWKKLIQGLRIRQRLQEQYATNVPSGDASEPVDQQEPDGHEVEQQEQHRQGAGGGGGFLIEADDVVQAFHLPRRQLFDDETLPKPNRPQQLEEPGEEEQVPVEETHEVDLMVDDDHLERQPPMVPILDPPRMNGVPKSMAEMAEEAAAATQQPKQEDASDDDFEPEVEVPLTSRKANGKRKQPVRKASTRTPKGRTTRKRAREYDDEASDEGDHQPSPPKRTRARASAPATIPATTTPASTSTRTLRPRRSHQPQKYDVQMDGTDDDS